MDDMTEKHAAVDVSRLPTVVFDTRGLMWWGTMAFIVIEGWTLALTAMAYFYLRQNSPAWPPHRTAEPDLLLPTINLVLLLVSLIPAWIAAKAAERLERRRTSLWLAVNGIMGVAALVLRWYELWDTNTRWDTTAYGSIVWLLAGLHGTLILLDVGDTVGISLKLTRKDAPPHYLADATDYAMYWLFTVASWIPIYLLIYVAPRFI